MSIWQTQSWQEMLIASKQSEEYFMIERDIQDVSSPLGGENGEGIIFAEKRKVSLGEYGLFIIGFEGELTDDLCESFQELCIEENCLFFQVETINYNPQALPQFGILFPPKEKIVGGNYVSKKLKNNLGYYKKFIPPFTVVIDLRQPGEDILKNMKQKGRYNIRLAEKKGVIIEQVEKNAYNAETFTKLMNKTTSRNNFTGNSQEYYETFLNKIPNSELMFAYFEDRVIAAGIFVYQDDVVIYYYGASDNEYRKLMAPYLLQFRAIQTAQKRGCKIYDFLGVAGPDEVNSSLAGVTDFKLKLSPDRRKVSTSYIFINKKIKYLLIHILKKLKR